MKLLRNMYVRAGLLSAASLATIPAHAAVDVSAAVTDIAAAATPIASIGGAVLLVIVGIKVFKWVRRAL